MNHKKVQVTSEIVELRVVQGPKKSSFGVLTDERKSGHPDRIPVQMQEQGLGPVKNIGSVQAVEKVKRELGAFVIPRNDHHWDARFGKLSERLNQVIQPLPWNIELIEKISAVDKQVRPTLKGMVYDFQKIPENGVRSSLSASAVRCSDLEHFKPEMGICGVNELQASPKII